MEFLTKTSENIKGPPSRKYSICLLLTVNGSKYRNEAKHNKFYDDL